MQGPDSEGMDEELRKVDAVLGTFICNLKTSGIYEETNIVIVSDHGKE